MKRRNFLILIPMFALVAACAAPPSGQALPELTFSHLSPIVLDVGRIDVVSEFKAPVGRGHVEHAIPISPEEGARRWAMARLKAGGRDGFARLVIKDGAVRETTLSRRKGVSGAFYQEQSERYDAALSVELGVYKGRATPDSYVAAEAARSRTVREDDSISDRKRQQFELVESLISDFDREMEKNIRAHFAAWIIQN